MIADRGFQASHTGPSMAKFAHSETASDSQTGPEGNGEFPRITK